LVGARGPLFSDWHYEVTAYLSRDRQHGISTTTADFQKVADALASSDPATALNPFASGAPASPQFLNTLGAGLSGSDLHESDRLVSGQGILRGSVGHLPAGAIQIAMGSEYRQEKQHETISFPVFGFSTPTTDLQRTAYAAFSEARVPLLAGQGESSGQERLAL